jgi:hypothetical protein
MLINVVLRRTGDLRSSYEHLLKQGLSPPSLLLPSLDQVALTAASDGRSRPRAISWMTQRLARRIEDRFITTSWHSVASAPWSVRRIDGDEVSGDRIKNGHGQISPVQAQEQRRAFRFRSSAIGVVVTRQLLHWMLTSPKQTEAVHPRPGCFGGGG